MNRRYGVTKTGRAIDILILSLFVPGVIAAIGWSLGIVIIDAIGGWLFMTAVTVALVALGFRTYGAIRYIVWGAAVIGGTCSVLGLNDFHAGFHWAAIIVWAFGAIIGGLGHLGSAGGAR